MRLLLAALLLCGVSVLALAQASAAVPPPQPAAEPSFLSPEHMYSLLVYAILGSLGVLGLILGLDKLIIMFFRKSDGAVIQKYSSESVARILPLAVEGITVILVILTVIILGVSRIVSAEGTLGILGSIVGYVLGKGARREGASTNGTGT